MFEKDTDTLEEKMFQVKALSLNLITYQYSSGN